MGAVKCATMYVRDLFSMDALCREALRNVSSDADVNRYISGLKRYKRPFSSITGLMIYDMIPGAGVTHRQMAGILTTKIYMAIDLADELVDSGRVNLNSRRHFLDSFRQNMFSCFDNRGKTIEENAAYSLAHNLYEEVFCRDINGKTNAVAGSLIELIKAQTRVIEPDMLMDLERLSGALTFEVIYSIMELLAQCELSDLREAIKSMGEYAEMMDGASDIDEDLLHGINTYGTATVRKMGNSASVRRKIRSAYMERASESFNYGMSFLSHEQRETYKFMKTMIDAYCTVFQKRISSRVRHTFFAADEKQLSHFS